MSDPRSLEPLPTQGDAFDPRAKLVVYLLSFGLILLTTRVTDLLLFNAVALLAVVVSRTGPSWWRIVRVLGPTLLLFALIVGLGSGPEAAVGAVLRLLALVTVSGMFFAITSPEELGEALLASGLPPQVAFLLEGTLRFTPTMVILAREVREAQESRGIRLDGFYLLRNGTALLTPLLVDVLRFADDLAEALETRGFGGPRRTPLTEYRLHKRDWILVVGAVLTAIAVGSHLSVA